MPEPPSRNMSRPPLPSGSSSQYPAPPAQGGQWGSAASYQSPYNQPQYNQPPSSGTLYPAGQPSYQPNSGQAMPPMSPMSPMPPSRPSGSAQNLPPWQNGNGTGTNYPPQAPGAAGMSSPYLPRPGMSSPYLPNPGMSSPYLPNPGMSGVNSYRSSGFASSQVKRRRRHSFARLRNKYKGFSPPVKVLSLILLFAILFSSLTGVFEIINGVILYTQISGAVNHLKAAEAVFQGGTKGDNSKYFAVANLQKAQIEITAAHSNFVSLSDELDHDGSLSLAGSILPSQMTALRKIGHIAVDGTAAAQQAVQTAIEIAPVIGPGLKAEKDPSKPYLDQASFNKVMALLSSIQPLVHDMSQNAQGISLTGLPISASQSKMITDILPLLPAVDNVLSQAPQYKDAIAWLLGIGGSRTILLDPMDSAELRSTGGFTGQFGELTFTGGHMAPLNMKNLGAYEEDHTGLPGGTGPINLDLFQRVETQVAPLPYGNWWPFANFGIRDANVSADFQTSAQIILHCYEFEFQKNADGLIAFTPQLIQQVLQVTGPVLIPRYNETITAQNLNAKLHYYQLDNVGIRREEIIEHQPDPELARKLFTQSVTKQLMLTAMHLSVSKLLPLATQMLQATKTKDLQIYFDNPQLEGLIGKYGSEAKMDRSNAYDGVFVVQSNDSVSKASQYVTTAIQDTVTVDTQGYATHKLLMTLNYQKKGDVFGFDTYRDYVRVYVPEGSTLLDGNGFAQDQTSCIDFNCQPDVYGDGSLMCTAPVVVGDATNYNDNLAYPGNRLNKIGWPTNNNISDEPGKGMFAGWVMIPKNCVMKVSLSWTSPPLGTNGYQMLLQAQGGIDINENISISDAACPSSSNLHYTKTIHGQNTMFSVQKSGSSCTLQNTPKW